MPISETGYRIRTREEYLNKMVDRIKRNFPDIDTTDKNALIVWLKTVSEELNEADTYAMQQYNNQYLTTSTGVHLEKFTSAHNIYRLTEQASTTVVQITGEPFSFVEDYFRASKSDGTEYELVDKTRRQLDEDGNIFLQLISTEKGSKTIAKVGDINKIETPMLNIDSVTNTEEAIGGRDEESDLQLRQRYMATITTSYGSTIQTLENLILQNTEASFCRGFENLTQNFIGDMPPMSIQFFVAGGENEEIARQIFNTKPAGVRIYGEIEVPITYNETVYNMYFSRPNIRPFEIEIELNVDLAEFIEDTVLSNIKSNLVSYINNGNQIKRSRVVSEIYRGNRGILSIDSLKIKENGILTTSEEIIGSPSELFKIELEDIQIFVRS